MTSSVLTKKQRREIIGYYMDAYSEWHSDEPTVYDQPAIRLRELNAMNNSELYKFIKSDCPDLLSPF